MKQCLLPFLVVILSAVSAISQLPESLWLDSRKEGDTVFFLRQLPYQIMRYDLGTEQWLSSVDLASEPTAFSVDDTYFYVAYNRQVVRIDRESGITNHITNTADTVNWIDLVGDHIVFADNSDYSSHDHVYVFDRATLSFEHERSTSRALSGVSASPIRSELYGRSKGISPSDIQRIELGEDGSIVSAHDSPYHGDYPSAQLTWCFPDGNRVADNSGTVYNTVDLTLNGSLGTSFYSMDFNPDGSVILLRQNEIASYDKWLRNNGSLDQETGWAELHIFEDSIFGFFNDVESANGIGVEKISMSDLSITPTADVLDPRVTEFEVDDSAIDSAGNIYLLSKNLFNIFVWSTAEQDWLASMPLRRTAELIEYAPATNRLYVFNSNREMSYFDLGVDEPTEESFANIPFNVNMIIPMQEEVFTGINGDWDSHLILDASGTVLGSNLFCCYTNFYTYHEGTSRFYMGIGDMGYYPYLGDGEFGDFVSGGYYSAYDYRNLVGLAPDATVMVTGDGTIISGETYSLLGYLSNNVLKAEWLDGSLVTIEDNREGAYGPYPNTTSVQLWSEYNILQDSISIPGVFVQAFKDSNQLIVLSRLDGFYRFTIINAAFQIVYSKPIYELEQNALSVVENADTSITLAWDLSSSDESEFNLQHYTADGWQTLARVQPVNAGYTIDGLDPNSFYDIRLATLERQVDVEAQSTINVDTNVYGNVNLPTGTDPFPLSLEKYSGSQWEFLRSIYPGGFYLIEQEFIQGDSLADLRVGYEALETFPLNSPVTEERRVHFNWLRSNQGDSGFRIVQFVSGELVELANLDSETFSFTIDSGIGFDWSHYKLHVFNGTKWLLDDLRQATLEVSLDWSGEADSPNGWHIESSVSSDIWQPVADIEGTAKSYTFREVDIRSDNRSFRVLRIEDTPAFTILPVSWQIQNSIYWSRENSGMVAKLQYRDGPDGDWAVLRSINSYETQGNNQHMIDNPVYYPEYRISYAVDVPAEAVGYVQATTLVESIQSTVVSGLRASDGDFYNKIALEWNPIELATGYEVLRNEISVADSASLVADVDAADGARFVDSPLPEDSIYYYWVRATDGTLYGMLSQSDAGSTGLYDEDNDGIPLPLENYLGRDASGYDLFGRVVTLSKVGDNWILIFPRDKGTDRYDFKIQWSVDLLSWHSEGVAFSEALDQGDHFMEQVNISAPGAAAVFIRFLEN